MRSCRVASFQQNLWGGGLTRPATVPIHPVTIPRPGRYQYRVVCSIDSRPTLISNIHLASFSWRQGLQQFHHSDKSPFSLLLGSANSLSQLTPMLILLISGRVPPKRFRLDGRITQRIRQRVPNRRTDDWESPQVPKVLRRNRGIFSLRRLAERYYRVVHGWGPSADRVGSRVNPNFPKFVSKI